MPQVLYTAPLHYYAAGSPFSVGDEIRNRTAWQTTGKKYTVRYVGADRIYADAPGTHLVIHDHEYGRYELVPKPFLPSGKDKFAQLVVIDGGDEFIHGVGRGGDFAPFKHLIKVDAQTGELSWAKGGPRG